MAQVKKYTVRYERGADGYWLATVEGVPGCYTQGRSLHAAMRRVPEAYEAATGESASDVAFSHHLEVAGFAKLAARVKLARDKAERAQVEAQRILLDGVVRLSKSIGERDAAVVLGISRQRINQVKKKSSEAGRRQRATDANG